MSALLLATKFHIPATRARLVPRPRLRQRLDTALQREHSLIVVSAPAGFGKTTLLVEWLQHNQLPAAWLSLDRGDNDPARFLAYLSAALAKIQPALQIDRLALPPSASLSTIEAALGALIKQLDELATPFALILDDYHTIDAPAIHDAVAFLFEHLPAQALLAIAGRSDPPLPLARLRGRAQLIELRAAELSFTSAEAAAFLNEVMNLNLAVDDVAALEERTEGWIVGLQMAALSLQGREDRSGFVRAFTGSHRFVLDYLIEEVLDQQPADVQDFLLQTSILDRLTAPLCDALTDRADSQAILQRLDQANLFIAPLDDERRWYRYHHLFADLLRARLQQTQPDRMLELQRRASNWLAQDDLIVDAVTHAQAARDIDRVVQLIETHGPALIAHGEFNTLSRWLDALPASLMASHPWLCVHHASLHVNAGQFEVVEQLLRTAEQALQDRPAPEAQRLRGHVAAIRCQIRLSTGDLARAEGYAKEALSNLSLEVQQDLMVRSLTAKSLAYLLRLNYDLAGAFTWINEAVASSRRTGDLHDNVSALCELALLHRERGNLHQAAATAQDALRLADEQARATGRRMPVAGEAQLCLGEILREWNRLPEALQQFQLAVESYRNQGQPESMALAYLSLSRGLLAAGDQAGALAAVHAARQAAQGFPPLYVIYIGAFEANIFLAQGKLAAARQWLEESRALGAATLLIPYRYIGFAFAHVLTAHGQFTEALLLLTEMQQATAGKGAIWSDIMTWTSLAATLYRRGRVELALSALERALTLAEPEGFMRVILDEGQPMHELLERMAARGRHLAYVTRLLDAFMRDEARQVKIDMAQLLTEPLTGRELEVLRLVATGHSNAAIAQTLVVSIETVKKHLKNIYGKLDVHSRMEAVSRAREAGLL